MDLRGVLMQGNGEKICCGFGGSPADLDGLLWGTLRFLSWRSLNLDGGWTGEELRLWVWAPTVVELVYWIWSWFWLWRWCRWIRSWFWLWRWCRCRWIRNWFWLWRWCRWIRNCFWLWSWCRCITSWFWSGVCGSEAGSGCGVGVGGSEAGSGCGDGSEAASDESSGSSSKEDSCLLISWRSSPSPELWSCWETSELTVSTFSCSSSSSLSSSDASSVLLTSVCSSSISCESSNPSCARALAMFLRCTRTCVRQGEWCLARIIWSWLGVEWAWGPPPLWMIPLFEDCWPGLGLLPRRRWLTTGEGPIWEGRILVAGHLSVKNQYQWVRKH